MLHLCRTLVRSGTTGCKAMSGPSVDRGSLWLNPVGRWEIRPRRDRFNVQRPLHEITSGDVIYLDVGGEWKLTRIEYDHQAQAYVSVDGYPLRDGIEAALPT